MNDNSSLLFYETDSFTLAFFVKNIFRMSKERDVFKIVIWYLLYIKVIHSNSIIQILDSSCYKNYLIHFSCPLGAYSLSEK